MSLGFVKRKHFTTQPITKNTEATNAQQIDRWRISLPTNTIMCILLCGVLGAIAGGLSIWHVIRSDHVLIPVTRLETSLRKRRGHRPQVNRKNTQPAVIPDRRMMGTTPSNWSWEFALPRIYNQEDCGSCYANTASLLLGYYLTYKDEPPQVPQAKRLLLPSRQYMTSCLGQVGCDGGNALDIMQKLISAGNVNLPKEDSMTYLQTFFALGMNTWTCPEEYTQIKFLQAESNADEYSNYNNPEAKRRLQQYNGADPFFEQQGGWSTDNNENHENSKSDIPIRVVDVVRLDHRASYKRFLHQVGPLGIAINAERWHRPKTIDFISKEMCRNVSGVDHNVVLIGFVETNNATHYLLRNSWGDEWGKHGVVEIEDDGSSFGPCNMFQEMPFAPVLYDSFLRNIYAEATYLVEDLPNLEKQSTI